MIEILDGVTRTYINRAFIVSFTTSQTVGWRQFKIVMMAGPSFDLSLRTEQGEWLLRQLTADED